MDKIINDENLGASVMMYALQSLGFYAEIVDYKMNGSTRYGNEIPVPVLQTNANKKEMLALFPDWWDDGFGDISEPEYYGDYDPVDNIWDDRCGLDSWLCHQSVDESSADPNFIRYYFGYGNPSVDDYVAVKLNQVPQYNSDKFLFFYSKGDYPQFSNFYPIEMKISKYLGKNPDGSNRYFNANCSSVEHYFQIMKALEFDPEGDVLKQMENDLTCAQVKALGRKVHNFDQGIWNTRRRFHMRNAVAMKFRQNAELRELLLATGDAVLAEASPRDTFWGIGYSGSNPKAYDAAQWRGKNVLGNMLMYLRDAIRAEAQRKET